MLPSLAKVPPAGEDWVHEVKFDGFPAQVHVDEGDAAIYSRIGADLTKRFRVLKPIIEMIPVRSAIIDCELVACGADGLPSFRTSWIIATPRRRCASGPLTCGTLTGFGSRPSSSPSAKAGSSNWLPRPTPSTSNFQGRSRTPSSCWRPASGWASRASSASAAIAVTGRARRAIG